MTTTNGADLPHFSRSDVVDTDELAQVCGVSRARIYEIHRSKRKGKGQADFPDEVVEGSGLWHRSEAVEYAQTRRRQPGPAPKADR